MSCARCALLAALVAVPVASAAADWLVLRDGSRVETKAEWQVEGRTIVFHSRDGRLSSLRVDQVDLGASRELTASAKAPAAATAPASPPATAEAPAAAGPPARRWTNEDVRRIGAGPPIGPPGTAAPGTPAAQGGGESADAAAEENAPSTVVVRDWDTELGANGLMVRGVLINPTVDRAAIDVRLTVVLFDQEGERVDQAEARVSPTSMLAGASGSFEAHFPDVHAYGAIRFDLSSQPLSQGEPAAAPDGPAGGFGSSGSR